MRFSVEDLAESFHSELHHFNGLLVPFKIIVLRIIFTLRERL